MTQLNQDEIKIVIALLTSQNWSDRFQAIKALGDTRNSEFVELLLPALKDENSAVRGQAVASLGNIGDPRATIMLLSVFEQDKITVRSIAARALGQIGDERAAPLLIKALVEKDQWLHESVYEALCKFKSTQTVDLLIAALKDNNWRVRCVASTILGKKGIVRALPTLIELIDNDKNRRVKEAAVKAVGLIEQPETKLYYGTVLDVIEADERIKIIASLSIKRDDQSLDLLIQALGDEDKQVKSFAVNALGARGDLWAVKPLIKALETAKGRVKFDIVTMLWQEFLYRLQEIGDEASIKQIVKIFTKLLEDKDADVRDSVAEALSQISAIEW